MKIQILSNLFPVPWAPNRAAFNRQQFENLAKSCEVRIIVIIPWLERLKNRGKAVARINNRIAIDYIWYLYLPKVARFLYPASLMLTLIFKIWSIRKFQPDVLLLSWAYPDAVAGTILSRILGKPAVIKIHGSDINLHLEHSSRAAQIRWSMRKAKAVISVSKALALKLVDLGVPESKIHVIYNGVNQSMFRPMDKSVARKSLQLDDKRALLLFIGNLIPEKGCIDLLTAFEGLAAQHSNIDLVYIGSGGSSEYINSRVEELDLRGRIRLLGSLSHDKLATWINACDLVTLPSYNEGVPNVLLEAMACGIPVVASRVGGIPEVVPEHAGLLHEPGDTIELSRALLGGLNRSWDSQAIAASMGDFTWEKNSSQVSALLRSVL